MADQLSLFKRMREVIGKPEPTQEQWLTSATKPDFFREMPETPSQPSNNQPNEEPFARGRKAIQRMGQARDRVQSQLDDGSFKLGGRRTKALSADVKTAFDRISDSRFHPVIAEFAEEYAKSNSQESIDDWNKRNNFENSADVIKFLEDPNGMGMIRDRSGKLISRPRSAAQNMAAGRAPGPGASFQPYRGITPKEREIYGDDDKIQHVIANKGGTSGQEINYETMRQFHKAAQKNGLSTEEIREVMQEINPSLLRSLIGIGAPPQGSAFNPPADWNATPNGQPGNWDGDTDYDTGSFDPDRQQGYLEGFGSADMQRAESYLQRLVNSGFRTEDTLLPVRGLDDITEDHIIGKELAQDLGVPDFRVDAPINRALISSNVNQVKSGENPRLGKDSFNKAIESIRGGDTLEKQFLEMLGGHEDGAEYEDELEDPRVLAYIAKRLTGAHFDPDRLGRVLGIENEDDEFNFPSSMDEVLGLSDDNLGRIMGATGDGILNLKQIGRLLPQPEGASQINPNTFDGVQNAQSGGSFKNNFGRALLMHVLQNPEMRSRYEQKESELRAPRIGKRGQELTPRSDKEITRALTQLRREMVSETVGPLKAAASLFSLGRLGDGSHGALPGVFKQRAEELLNGLGDDPETLQKIAPLLEGLGQDTDDWTSKLTERYGGKGPQRFGGDNDGGVMDAMRSNADWAKAIMASREARNAMTEDEKTAFFSQLTPQKLAELQDPIYEEDESESEPFIAENGKLRLTAPTINN